MDHFLYLLPAAALSLFLLERFFPLRRPKSPLLPRLAVNAMISALAIAVALVVVQPVAMAVLEFVSAREWGLTQLISANMAVQAVIAFVLTDLSFYYWHRANHAW